MLVAELLAVLTQHAGREYQATLLPPQGRKARKNQPSQSKAQQTRPREDGSAVLQNSSTYLFVRRGEQIEATGPSGQTRLLSPQRFEALFAQASFAAVSPTGRLSDLGPLFTQETL